MSDSDDKAQEIANAQPDRQGQMGPDMSDSFEQQAALLPEENIDAPVEKAPGAHTVPDENFENGQDAKLDIMEDKKEPKTKDSKKK